METVWWNRSRASSYCPWRHRITPAAFAPRPAVEPPRLPVRERLLGEAEVVLEIPDGCGEAARCLQHEPALVLPALEATLKTSHLFNLMDARGAVSVTERVALIARVRRNAVAVAKAYLAQREALGFPLMTGVTGGEGVG